ncbi:hypothetical protein J8273_1040 [Carpediemonas membranifera]|uniref:Uncharacterized protein n=1 Tax=Carpediemonas membranifera TaxID=201153 RepID=A0A8J6E6I0_9EUKA|nr:hypothetical protein J8273_1040 [Carpediemonas membranifera]|eukprot:KAG9397132.1 hypothetical protein J8273_1040 [Carpediemonas membranifera]
MTDTVQTTLCGPLIVTDDRTEEGTTYILHPSRVHGVDLLRRCNDVITKGFSKIIEVRLGENKDNNSNSFVFRFPLQSTKKSPEDQKKSTTQTRQEQKKNERFKPCTTSKKFADHPSRNDFGMLTFAAAHNSARFSKKWDEWHYENDDGQYLDICGHQSYFAALQARVRNCRNDYSHGGHLKRQTNPENPSSLTLNRVIGQIKDGIHLLQPFADGKLGASYKAVSSNVAELENHKAFIDEFRHYRDFTDKLEPVFYHLLQEKASSNASPSASEPQLSSAKISENLIRPWIGRLTALADRLEGKEPMQAQDKKAAANVISHMGAILLEDVNDTLDGLKADMKKEQVLKADEEKKGVSVVTQTADIPANPPAPVNKAPSAGKQAKPAASVWGGKLTIAEFLSEKEKKKGISTVAQTVANPAPVKRVTSNNPPAMSAVCWLQEAYSVGSTFTLIRRRFFKYHHIKLQIVGTTSGHCTVDRPPYYSVCWNDTDCDKFSDDPDVAERCKCQGEHLFEYYKNGSRTISIERTSGIDGWDGKITLADALIIWFWAMHYPSKDVKLDTTKKKGTARVSGTLPNGKIWRPDLVSIVGRMHCQGEQFKLSEAKKEKNGADSRKLFNNWRDLFGWICADLQGLCNEHNKQGNKLPLSPFRVPSNPVT